MKKKTYGQIAKSNKGPCGRSVGKEVIGPNNYHSGLSCSCPLHDLFPHLFPPRTLKQIKAGMKIVYRHIRRLQGRSPNVRRNDR